MKYTIQEKDDVFSYFYDVTEVFKNIMGESLKKVLLQVGVVFKDEIDNFNSIYKDRFEKRVTKFISDMKKGNVSTEYMESIIFIFNNNNKIRFSSIEGFIIENLGKGEKSENS